MTELQDFAELESELAEEPDEPCGQAGSVSGSHLPEPEPELVLEEEVEELCGQAGSVSGSQPLGGLLLSKVGTSRPIASEKRCKCLLPIAWMT